MAFKFQHIELLKEQILGIGSYGSVCKAKCDDLVCAAKIIHPTLVAPNERQQTSPQRMHRLPSARFELECDFLKDIRHPNIIQFIGMYQDPGTGLPVLLMELMDESLTHFLESSVEPVPYHIQVGISQDVSIALSFLHLNGIIHRDLSSSNILLNGKGSTAKLTDFGMAKLVDRHMARVSQTICPGTIAYMPPEAMNNQAVFSEKSDVFSFGVNIIQIVTKRFPDPGRRFKMVTIDDPRFRPGSLGVFAPEVERRLNHISEISPNHPLLPIALDCLKDKAGERPSVGDLCKRLVALKDTSAYRESVRNVDDRGQRIEELEITLAVSDQLIKTKDIQLSSKENVLERLQDEIRQSKQDIDDSKASEEESNTIDQQITELRKQVEILQIQFSQHNLKRMEIENEHLKRELIAKDQKQEGHEKLFLNEFTSSQHQSSSDRVISSPQSPEYRESEDKPRTQQDVESELRQLIQRSQQERNRLCQLLQSQDERIKKLERENSVPTKDTVSPMDPHEPRYPDPRTHCDPVQAVARNPIARLFSKLNPWKTEDYASSIEHVEQTATMPVSASDNTRYDQTDCDSDGSVESLVGATPLVLILPQPATGTSCVDSDDVTGSSVEEETLGISKYEKIAHGGFGKVYKVTMTDGSILAGKVFKDETVREYLRKCLNREMRSLEECDHSHIVKYYGSRSLTTLSRFSPILLMEMMDKDFQVYYTDEPNLSCHNIADILVQVARGLGYLHSHHPIIIHRDLSAKNVLLNVRSSPPLAKITDFGNSRFLKEVTTQMTIVKGTRYYLAPEVHQGSYTCKIDVFSFGHLSLSSSIQQVISTLPDIRYKPDSCESKLYHAHTEVKIREEYFDILRKRIGHNKPFEALVKQCLSVEPENRPSAHELVERLTAILAEPCEVSPFSDSTLSTDSSRGIN